MDLARQAALAALLFLSPLAAQCPVKSATFTPYGSGCNTAFPREVPKLGAAFAPKSCSISLWILAYPGCCNVIARQQVFAFGIGRSSVPLPGGCALLVNPLVVLPVDRSVRVVNAKLPTTTTLGTFHAQGYVAYSSTLSRRTSPAFTQGLEITFR